ncbi:multicopper oxidase domain-containing protein, partial [Candidatus Dojkabacteria bacterium]|nr:multicopper oxidase domain-containing protein [Candidatus Dojkabacteria bacterium]
ERGLYGILIVEDQVEYAYSQDVTWVIDDWLIQDDYQVYPSFVTMHDLAHDGRWGNVITVNGKLKENLVVAPGERIRLRLINTSNGRVYRPDFGNLEAKVIAVDGMYVKEVFDASGFELAPGNRIDVDITIPKDATGFGYTVTDNYTGYLNVLASFEVSGEPTDINNFSYPTNSRIPDWDEVEKSMVDVEYKLDAKSSGGMMMGNLNWTINNEIYPDVEPYALSYNEFSVIKFKNMSPRLHPMHIHGMFFKVLYRDGKKVNEPYFRDTVLINPEESVIVGMVPMDKGLWLNHCHIQEHAEAGMMTIIEVK